MFLCGVIGEDYNGFVMNANLYLLTLKGDELMVSFEDLSQVLPNVGFTGFILNKCAMIKIFSKYFSNGVSGFIFQCAIQYGILCMLVSRIGLRGVFDGTVGQCYDYLFLTINSEV
jgi:hypothetical protein